MQSDGLSTEPGGGRDGSQSPLTRADLEAVVAPLATKADIAALRADISELKTALTWRIVLAFGAFAALVRLMP